MEFQNQRQELEPPDPYWKYKEMKSFYKLIHRSQNKHIPFETRKKLFQKISDLMITALPEEVDVLELFPNTDLGFSTRCKGFKNVWTFKEVNEYMDDLVREMYPDDCDEKRIKGGNRFFERDSYKNFEKDEKEELRAYKVLLKTCKQIPLLREERDDLFNEIENILEEKKKA